MARPVPAAPQSDAARARSIVAGIGCRRGTGADEIVALIGAALAGLDRDLSALAAIATLDRKADEPGLLAAAAQLGVPLRTFSAGQLAPSQSAPSAALRLVGVASVAEAAAAMAGPLVRPKQTSARATCALAACAADFDLDGFGHAVPGSAPASTAAMAVSRSLTSNAGP